MNRIFVYGTLKRGGRWYKIFDMEKYSTFIEEDALQAGTLHDYAKSYPVLLEDEGRVQGEVFDVEDSLLKAICDLEVGAGYVRKMSKTEKGHDVSFFVAGKRLEAGVLTNPVSYPVISSGIWENK